LENLSSISKLDKILLLLIKKKIGGAWRGDVDKLEVKSIHIRDSIDKTIIFET
jgi:hypothetical protein